MGIPEGSLPLSEFRPVPKLAVRASRIEQPRFPVVDAHNHVSWAGDWRVVDAGSLVETMDATGVRVYVCLDFAGPDDPRDSLAAHLRRFKEPYPDRFAVFARPDWRVLEEPGFETALAHRLRECAALGAQGLKVWKDLGLRLRDSTGRLLRVNDRRLDPLFEQAGALGLPVLIHVADPVAFFKPLDGRNERYEELLEHPDWHFYGGDFPPFEQIMDDLRDLIGRHRETVFIGAHVGCYAENLDYVGAMFREFPNYHVDISARIAELGRQPFTARRFFLEFQDRILFGLDSFPPALAEYQTHYRFLETEDEYFDYTPDGEQPQGRWRIYGLNLPDEVLAKVYQLNACRLLPGLPKPGFSR